MIVFGPIMVLFLLGSFFMIMDIIYTKDEDTITTSVQSSPIKTDWMSEYSDEQISWSNNEQIKDNTEDDIDFLS